jgi:TPP-dependent pyruvate/acetoin dehydrogenase alpha subunit
MIDGLLGLDNPHLSIPAIGLTENEAELLVKLLRQMLLIRKVEQKLAFERKAGSIGGPVHLGVGQEAAAVGVSHHLFKSDMVFGAHRSHSHYLALGGSVHALFAEVLGKKTGCSKGMGGSMHLWDQSNGFYGSVPIVAGTVSLAVGAALGTKLKNIKSVAIAYFGDGAIEEGIVHESLNLASTMQLPIIFVVENNLFASHMHISLRQPNSSVSRFAVANNIQHKLVDGNDVLAVSDAAKQLIFDARDKSMPGFLELVTHRWYGHVDWREDIDVGVHRSSCDLEAWRKKDPIQRLSDALVAENKFTVNGLSSLHEELNIIIESCWIMANNDEYPMDDALLACVYAPERN